MTGTLRPSQTALVYAPDCGGCAAGATRYSGVKRGAVALHTWTCSVHGLGARAHDVDRDVSLTIVGGTDPSPTVATWLDAMSTQQHRRIGAMELMTRTELDAWIGDEPLAVDEATAALFAAFDVDRADMEALLGFGVTSALAAQAWQQRHGSPDEWARWIGAGFTDPIRVDRFQRIGCRDPQVAARFAHPTQWWFAHTARVPLTVGWGMLGNVTSPTFAHEGHRQGWGPSTIAALAGALDRAGYGGERTTPQFVPLDEGVTMKSAWTPEQDAARTAIARQFAHLDWNDWAACIDVGMSAPEAAAFLDDGGDMTKVRFMAALT